MENLILTLEPRHCLTILKKTLKILNKEHTPPPSPNVGPWFSAPPRPSKGEQTYIITDKGDGTLDHILDRLSPLEMGPYWFERTFVPIQSPF
jgi:hypothetical protein